MFTDDVSHVKVMLQSEEVEVDELRVTERMSGG